MEFQGKETMNELLGQAMQDKARVTILVTGGVTYQGNIEQVGKLNLRLKRTDERSYFDVIISIDQIVAFEFQVRGL